MLDSAHRARRSAAASLARGALLAGTLLVCRAPADAAQSEADTDTVVDLSVHAFEPVVPVRTRNGDAVFLRELYTLRRAEDFLIARFLGFNAVIEHGAATFEFARTVDFLVTEANWLTTSTCADAGLEARLFKDEPLLLAYNLNDEPDLRMNSAPPAAMATAAASIRAEDPGAVISVTLAGAGRGLSAWPEYAPAVDMLRVDPYPLVSHKPLRHVRDLVEAARSAAGPDKPVICILQAWHMPGEDLPTGDQIAQMAWQALIAGAGGLSYYDWNYDEWSRRPAFWRSLIRVNTIISQDLAPFLTEGSRTPATQAGDVYAACWRHPELGWRILAVRMGADDAGVDVRLRLPEICRESGDTRTAVAFHRLGGDGPVMTALRGRELRLHMPPLAAVVIGSPPLDCRDPGLAWGAEDDCRQPVSRGTRVYRTDIAGRPLTRVHTYGRGRERSVTLKPYTACRLGGSERTPFEAAGMSLRISGDSMLTDPFSQAGLVSRIYPGGRFVQTLRVSPGRARDLSVEAVEWRDTQRGLADAALAAIVSLERAAPGWTLLPSARKQTYRLTTQPPLGREWPTQRHHLLKLRLRYRYKHKQYVTDRVLRYRIEKPFDFKWCWTGADTGLVTLTARFPDAHLPCARDELELQCDGDGVRAELRPATAADTWLGRFVPADPGKDRMVKLSAEVRAAGKALDTGFLTTLWCRDGEIRSPRQQRVGSIARLSAAPDFGAAWDELWPALCQAAPMDCFLELAEHQFTPDLYETRLAFDSEHLYWAATAVSPRDLRAETTEGDAGFLADDVVMLLVQGRNGDDLYQVRVNPKGMCRVARVYPEREPRSAERLAVRAHVDGRTWRVAVAVPWELIGWQAEPAAGELLRFNVAGLRSIAPRIVATWHYVSIPFAPETSLATVAIPGT